jgi:hypothetical protein
VVRLLHGHKSVETTTKYYCGMETAAAVKLFDQNMLNLQGHSLGHGREKSV